MRRERPPAPPVHDEPKSSWREKDQVRRQEQAVTTPRAPVATGDGGQDPLERAERLGHSLANLAKPGASPPRIQRTVWEWTDGSWQVYVPGERDVAPDEDGQFEGEVVDDKDSPAEEEWEWFESAQEYWDEGSSSSEEDEDEDVEPPAKKRKREEFERVPQTLSFVAWNIERLGKSSSKQKKRKYAKYLARTIEVYRPTAIGLEEVGDAVDQLGSNVLEQDFLEQYREHEKEIDEDEIDLYSGSEAEEDEDTSGGSSSESEDEFTWEGKGKRKIGAEYGFARGPKFESGDFREYYPIFYDKAVVIGTPELIITDAKTRDLAFDQGKSRPFKSKKTARGPAFWRLTVRATRYNTRSSHSEDLDREQTMDVYYGVVHTTPGMITRDVQEILEAAAEVAKIGDPVVIGGDWYMQRGAKRQWTRLQRSSEWDLAAPEGNTNYKSGGEGQVADHFVFGKGAQMDTPLRLQPPKKIPFEPFSGRDREEQQGNRSDIDTAKQVKKKVGSDHTAVLGLAVLDPRQLEPPAPEQIDNVGTVEDVDGTGMDCLIRSVLRAATGQIDEQVVAVVRLHLIQQRVARPGRMLDLANAAGGVLISYLVAQGVLNAQRGLRVYYHGQGGQFGFHTILNGPNPINLWLSDEHFQAIV